jgi:hypothetical protein
MAELAQEISDFNKSISEFQKLRDEASEPEWLYWNMVIAYNIYIHGDMMRRILGAWQCTS